MRRYCQLSLLLILSSAAALAQRSTFYWLADVGAVRAFGTNSFRAGLAGGGEIAIAKGFSAGPEIGFIAPKEGRFGDTVAGLGSLNGYYHVRHRRDVRFDPFATMGYAVLFRSDSINMFQYGGGLNYWARPDLAFRAEFQDRTWGVNPGSAHLWTFRMGISFTHLFP